MSSRKPKTADKQSDSGAVPEDDIHDEDEGDSGAVPEDDIHDEDEDNVDEGVEQESSRGRGHPILDAPRE